MSLEAQTREIMDNFHDTSSEEFLEVLNQIKPQFKNKLTSEYLEGKIQKINETTDEAEKKKQCKGLLPYLDWYLQGL